MRTGRRTNMQLFQTSDHVAIMNEMMHTVRAIPLDGRPALERENAARGFSRMCGALGLTD